MKAEANRSRLFCFLYIRPCSELVGPARVQPFVFGIDHTDHNADERLYWAWLLLWVLSGAMLAEQGLFFARCCAAGENANRTILCPARYVLGGQQILIVVVADPMIPTRRRSQSALLPVADNVLILAILAR